MNRVRWIAALAALALGSCGSSIEVEQASTEVLTTLASLPAEADAVGLATAFPGTASHVEAAPDKVTWHFTRNGQEYGRFVAALDANGDRSTSVSTDFEQVQAGPYPAFLGRVAEMVTHASIEAALAKRPVDRAALQAAIRDELAKDPAVAQTVTVEAVGSVMNEFTGGQ